MLLLMKIIVLFEFEFEFGFFFIEHILKSCYLIMILIIRSIFAFVVLLQTLLQVNDRFGLDAVTTLRHYFYLFFRNNQLSSIL
jgi:hypothetical protein